MIILFGSFIINIFFVGGMKLEQDNGGIVFNYKEQILLAEKFINIQFLVPFPAFNVTFGRYLDNISSALDSIQVAPKYGCKLTYTETNETILSTKWMLSHTRTEYQRARQDIISLKSEISKILQLENSNSAGRHPRAVPLLALGAAGLGSLGLGFGVGSSCGLKGIFGSCDQTSKINSKNIQVAMREMELMRDDWTKVQTENDNKFFIVARELSNIRDTQDKIITTQNENFQSISKSLDLLRRNVAAMLNCDQFLFIRDQQLQVQVNVLSLLSTLLTEIKTFRLAVHEYRMNILNSVTLMANRLIPMSLLPKDTLQAILEQVVIDQIGSRDRLTLALSPTSILTYYEAELLSEVSSNEDGLLFTISVPMASKETVLNLYDMITIPMPSTNGSVLSWDLPTRYVAISENEQEYALLDESQLASCKGSSSVSICEEGFAVTKIGGSCIGALLQYDILKALETCDIIHVSLPAVEKASNLGLGRWLITSNYDTFVMRESRANSSGPLDTIRHKGCRVCVVSLPCGSRLQTANMVIRSDLQHCREVPSVRVNIQLSSALDEIFGMIPPLDLLPHVSTVEQAESTLLRDMQMKLKTMPRGVGVDHESVIHLATPIVSKLRTVRPEFTRHIQETSNWRFTLSIAVTSFTMSMLLHFAIPYLYHRYLKRYNLFATHDKDINAKQIRVLADDDFEMVMANKNHPLHQFVLIKTSDIEGSGNPYNALARDIKKVLVAGSSN